MGTRIDYTDLQALVEEGHRRAERKRSRKGRGGRWLRRLLLDTAALAALAVLPFFLLVRVGVHAHGAWGLGPWTSLASGMAATALVLIGYAWVVGRRTGAGPRARRILRRGAVALVAAWTVYGLVYVAGRNVKEDTVRAEYVSLHPLLRVMSSLVFLADPGSVMTDAGRTPEDYELWGLEPREASLHHLQEDGFVHAVDFRTKGRSELRNRALETAFWLSGFHALRHRGTADHLHVSLRPPDR